MVERSQKCDLSPKTSVSKNLFFSDKFLGAFVLRYVVFAIKMFIWGKFQVICTILLEFRGLKPLKKGQKISNIK